MTNPGVLARRFADGKRLKYQHPAKFYIFISVVFFFIFSFTMLKAENAVSKALEKEFNNEISLDSLSDRIIVDDPYVSKKMITENLLNSGISDEESKTLDSFNLESQNFLNSSLGFQKELLDSLIVSGAPQLDKLKAMEVKENTGVFMTKVYTQLLKLFKKRGGRILKALFDTIPIAMFFMLPLFALLLNLFYWRRGTFVHHLVFSFYFFTFCLQPFVHSFWQIHF